MIRTIFNIYIKLCFYGVLGFLLFLSFNQNILAEEDIPLTKLSQNVGAPTMKFLYCYSCGYRKTFEQYVDIIQQKYPFIIVDGAHYDPPGMNMFIARLIGIIKMLIIACILGSVNIFEFINQPRPAWWAWFTENKLYSCMMIFFVCNIFETQLVQSGAFEIILNDVPIWSKLETGRIPQPTELFHIIETQMQFDNKIELNKGFPK